MSCYRFDLHKKYLRYMHGMLPSPAVQKIEKHIARCSECASRIERMRSTEKLLTQLPHPAPANDAWPNIQSRLGTTFPVSSSPQWKRVAIIAAVGLISGFLGAATYGRLLDRESFLESSFRPDEFKPVSITRIAQSTEPHIVTEGYVIEARVEREDGDRVFKLVERLNDKGPFVICEVIEPLNVPVPPVGSRVRVYGVSRYDAKSNHNWHEVHPVLNIEILEN